MTKAKLEKSRRELARKRLWADNAASWAKVHAQTSRNAAARAAYEMMAREAALEAAAIWYTEAGLEIQSNEWELKGE